ncbi:MAG: DUF4011 domain-containing protein [Clostridiales bacterium]|nr:DUF4011 domain-containing protein [Clostridiales bacterium]
MTQEELYKKLVELRNKLKLEFSSNGRAPAICSDSALQALAAHPPRLKSDLSNIEGLGQTFEDKYGDYFMAVINEYHNQGVNATKISKELRNTLKSLENRLVNISRKNRLLYIGRPSNKTAMDLYDKSPEYNQQVVDLILGRKSSITLCEMSLKDNWETDEKRFKKALTLIREVSKELRETGQYDLYIGYPYVMGNTYGEDFPVRAPLVLFPVSFEKKPDSIVLKRDKSKDILFNSNLILTQYKFLKKADDVPNTIMEEIYTDTFLKDVKAFYEQHDIKVQGEMSALEKFEDISYKDFPKLKNGEYHLVNNAVLGRFSVYSTALQKDYRDMAKAEKLNILVEELLEDMDKVDMFAESTEETQEVEVKKEDKVAEPFSELNINYINDLNSSQEKAVYSVGTQDKLVVQGPPGTGKSQMITSLIADAVNKGKTVLMVSQKKAALDVIYSRLGHLSSFVVMLNDMKDKTTFYKQLHNIFACNKDVEYKHEHFVESAKNIDALVGECKLIADTLVNNNLNGARVLDIYEENANNYWTSTIDATEIDTYYNLTNRAILTLDYNALKGIRDKFKDTSLLSDTLSHVEILHKHKWISSLKNTLNEFDKRDMKKAFEDFASAQAEFVKQSFFKKLFGKGKRKRALRKAMKPYTKSRKFLNYLYKNPDKLVEGCEYYSEYQRTVDRYSALDKLAKLYIDNLYRVSAVTNESHATINSKFFDFVTYYLLTNFEETNRLAMTGIVNFNTTITNIVNNMAGKKDLTKDRMKETLSTSFYQEILMSKRYLEICRQIQSQRKWSIAKFLEKFSFELLCGIKVWLMTPETVSEVLPLQNGLFDLLIFDEASQIYIEKGIPSIVRAKKVVVAGDHKQLRPSSLGFGRIDIDDEEIIEEDTEANAALEEESLLDLARFKYPSVMLNYHYRAKFEELINFSNYAFYDARLTVSPNTIEPEKPPIEVIKIDNGMWKSRCNKEEAKKVVAIIKEFLLDRKNKETMGIITFNTNQREAILDEIDRECLKDQQFSNLYKKELERTDNGEDIGIFVKNIENVQGDERDHIIFSIGYAKNEEGKVVRNFGWLNQQGGENRLNVAISRAKRKITIVTSIFPEELEVSDLKNMGPKLFRKYLEYCFAISKKDRATARVILNSLIDNKEAVEEQEVDSFTAEVMQELENVGITSEASVGMGNYKVDIALKNSKGDKYVLAIELDKNLYKTNLDDRERDIFRKQYLECRGWTVYRLWSKDWWRNRHQEIAKIAELYKTLNK